MDAFVQLTRSNRWKRLRAIDATGAYPAVVALPAAPSGDGVIVNGPSVLQPQAAVIPPVQNILRMLLYGTGAGGTTFSTMVLGWDCDMADVSTGTLWVPTPLMEWTLCTLSTFVGLTSQAVDAAHNFCDRGTANANYPSSFADLTGNQANLPALFEVDMRGFPIVQVIHAMGTATNANGFYSTY